jgi:hypothetical protein
MPRQNISRGFEIGDNYTNSGLCARVSHHIPDSRQGLAPPLIQYQQNKFIITQNNKKYNKHK